MNPRQRSFAHHYASGESARKAALSAGYSKSYAAIRSSNYLLQQPEIIAEIKRLRALVNRRVEKNAVDVINQFSKIAFSDRVGFLKPDPLREGEFIYKSPDELTQEQRDVVENTKMYMAEVIATDQENGRIVFRQQYVYTFSEKAKALEQMGRHFGIFDDKLKLGIAQNNPFANASPKQLVELKEAFVKTMNDKEKAVEGEFVEVKNGS